MEACNLYEDDIDLLTELLNDELPFPLLPQEVTTESFDSNKLISNIYSGPTITDIEAALASSSYTNNTHDFSSLTRTSNMEKGGLKFENKYILKIKSRGNVMSDDGYKWRKYGQKSIKNSANPRSYYKCTNPRCGAKKQIERSNEDPDTLVITYEGLHLHYMYPFFTFSQCDDPNPPTKKFRSLNFETGGNQQLTRNKDERIRHVCIDQPLTDYHHQVDITSQGLLEDMVPLLIRNPTMHPSLLLLVHHHRHHPQWHPLHFHGPQKFDAYLIVRTR